MSTHERTVSDVMSAAPVSVDEFTHVKDVARILTERGFNGVPVVTRMGRLVGLITEDDLVMRQDPEVRKPPHFWSDPHRSERQRSLGSRAHEVMTTGLVVVAAETSLAEAARLMHERHIKSLPVVDDEGQLVGMVTRRDLVRLFTRTDHAIAGEVADCLEDLSVDARSIHVYVEDGVVTLTGWVDRAGEATNLGRQVAQVDGVVSVRLWVNAGDLLEANLAHEPSA